MRRLNLIGMVLVPIAAAGCANTPWQDPVEQQLAAMEEVSTVLEGIRDDSSARTALPRLERAAARLSAANARAKASQRSSGDPKRDMEQLNDPKIQKAISDLTAAGLRMVQAQLKAEMSAPRYREQIAAAMRKANVVSGNQGGYRR